VFENKSQEAKAITWLKKPSQGKQSVHAFTSKFRLKIADAGWDDKAARDTLRRALSPEIQKLLLAKVKVKTLDELIQQATEAAAVLEDFSASSGDGPLQATSSSATVQWTSTP
jgi:hypothetical protein